MRKGNIECEALRTGQITSEVILKIQDGYKLCMLLVITIHYVSLMAHIYMLHISYMLPMIHTQHSLVANTVVGN